MLRRLYDWTLRLAAHPRALLWLGILSFAESSVFPIPPDAMMLPMMFAQPKRSVRIATVATITSVAGGMLGYAIGALLFDTIGRDIIAFYGLQTEMSVFQSRFAEYGWWIVIAGGFTPLPYKLITISAGVADLDLLVFFMASLLSRGTRFFLEAVAILAFGERVRRILEDRLELFACLGFLLLVGGFVAAKFLAG